MNLQDTCRSLKPIQQTTKLGIQEKLNSGTTLLCAEMHGTKVALKYLFRVHRNILFCYTLTESTETEIVLTLDQTNKMIPGIFNILFDNYLVKQDLLLEDVKNNFASAKLNHHNLSDADIFNQMQDTDILHYQ